MDSAFLLGHDAGWSRDVDDEVEDGHASRAKQAPMSSSLPLPHESLRSPAKVMEIECTVEAVRARLMHTELQIASPTRRRSFDGVVERSASLPAIRIPRDQERHSHDSFLSSPSRLNSHPRGSRARLSVQDESRKVDEERALEVSSLPGSLRSIKRGGANKPVRSTRGIACMTSSMPHVECSLKYFSTS